jgi:catechol 2,3-dioxygenase-like lactoylglutathione lyase family enzyme
MSTALFENVCADFIQPVSEQGIFADRLHRSGAGLLALVHRVADGAALESELARLQRAGANPAADTTWREGRDTVRVVFLDTVEKGKYSLALAVMPPGRFPEHSRRVTQYAFVAKDLDAVSAYWAKLGLPPMSYSHSDSSELIYRDKPGAFDMRLGWQRHGKVVYEWIQPLRGPSTYEEQLTGHGEGFHHLAFNVEDMDAGNQEWNGFGFPLVMGGAWGKKGKPGSGRFAYHDLDACCGHEVELLWNFKTR